MIRMATHNGKTLRFGLPCILAGLAIAGCQENQPGYSPLTASTNIPKPVTDISADRGVPVAPAAPVNAVELAGSRNLGSRGPASFAMLGEERAFDMSQRTESVLNSLGGYAVVIEATFGGETDVRPVVEPVPNWRLSGTLIGQGVMALLDTGRITYEIRPGMMVPGTEWRVVSIDADRALLARDGAKLPKQFWVGLSGPIAGPGITIDSGQGANPPAGGTSGGSGVADR